MAYCFVRDFALVVSKSMPPPCSLSYRGLLEVRELQKGECKKAAANSRATKLFVAELLPTYDVTDCADCRG